MYAESMRTEDLRGRPSPPLLVALRRTKPNAQKRSKQGSTSGSAPDHTRSHQARSPR